MTRYWMIGILSLSACASAPPPVYYRADAKPDDPVQKELILAQCKGEGAQKAPGWSGSGATNPAKEASDRAVTAIIGACMARHGYLSQPPR